MKKIIPYKIIIVVCVIAMFLGMGVLSTQFNNYRQESEQAVLQLQENEQQKLGRIARETAGLLLQADVFDAETVYVYDLVENEVIFEKNSDTPRNLASFAKIVLARMVLDTPLVSTDVCMTQTALDAINDQGFQVGECYTMPEALKAMLVSSSNDLATAIGDQAREAGFSLDAYIEARDLDMVIYDPSGYDFGQQAKTSRGYAHDIVMAAYDIFKKYPDIALATTQENYTLADVTVAHTYPDVAAFPELRFAKTGYTALAGGNMMGIIEPAPGSLVGVVVMRSGFDTRFDDFASIVDDVRSAYYVIR